MASHWFVFFQMAEINVNVFQRASDPHNEVQQRSSQRSIGDLFNPI